VNDADSLNGLETDSIPDAGILAALPRTRPQRATARRTAARGDRQGRTRGTLAAEAPATARASKKPKQKSKSKPTRTVVQKPTRAAKRTAKIPAKPVDPPVPKQGYEPEEEVALGATVHPPSGVELVESVADIVGELAGSSLAAGGRLLKDALSLLRRP
jgi:hypothetical protein